MVLDSSTCTCTTIPRVLPHVWVNTRQAQLTQSTCTRVQIGEMLWRRTETMLYKYNTWDVTLPHSLDHLWINYEQRSPQSSPSLLAHLHSPNKPRSTRYNPKEYSVLYIPSGNLSRICWSPNNRNSLHQCYNHGGVGKTQEYIQAYTLSESEARKQWDKHKDWSIVFPQCSDPSLRTSHPLLINVHRTKS